MTKSELIKKLVASGFDNNTVMAILSALYSVDTENKGFAREFGEKPLNWIKKFQESDI